jgi:hypothetical protein
MIKFFLACFAGLGAVGCGFHFTNSGGVALFLGGCAFVGVLAS